MGGNYFLRDCYASGTQDEEVAKSLDVTENDDANNPPLLPTKSILVRFVSPAPLKLLV